jgi:hypothetical protein
MYTRTRILDIYHVQRALGYGIRRHLGVSRLQGEVGYCEAGIERDNLLEISLFEQRQECVCSENRSENVACEGGAEVSSQYLGRRTVENILIEAKPHQTTDFPLTSQ